MVTHAGGKELEEPVVVRPTSETVIGEYMAKWIQSYRDLPLLLNQWANVVRWELRPRLFLRTSEFLWQEGHTAHATVRRRAAPTPSASSARSTPTSWSTCWPCRWSSGRKTAKERFAGAINTLTCEAMMGDGKALQMGTSHELGPELRQGLRHPVPRRRRARSSTRWTTSWGVSTRMVGGLIMGHGDDGGLRLPPRLAPIQVVVMAVRDDAAVVERCRSLAAELTTAGRAGPARRPGRAVGRAPGHRLGAQGRAGAPRARPRDLAEGAVTLVDRIDGHQGRRARWPASTAAVTDALDAAQAAMFAGRHAARDARTVDVATLEEAREASQTGLGAGALVGASGAEGEDELASSAVTVRCLVRPDGSLPAGRGRARSAGHLRSLLLIGVGHGSVHHRLFEWCGPGHRPGLRAWRPIAPSPGCADRKRPTSCGPPSRTSRCPIEVVALDVCDQASVDAAFAQVHDQVGALDVLVNNAGISPFAAVEDQPVSEAQLTLETNLIGPLRTIQAVDPGHAGHVDAG